MFNQKLKFIYATVITLAISFLFTQVVFAQEPGDLIVVFNPNPLFNETNFEPGESTVGTTEVGNKSGQTKQIITEAINASDPEGLGDVLNLEIKEGDTSLYSGSLTDFFSAGEVLLSSLATDSTTTYSFIVSFNEQAGDVYQGKALNNFDILIGFQGEDDSGQVSSSGSRAGSGSVTGLTIANQAEIEIEDTSVTIEWLTSYFSTSQVVYSAASESHIFDLNGTNYGYAHAYPDPEDSTKVTAHSVTIPGLIAGTTYFYRAVSHASPPSISREFSFTTLSVEGLTVEAEDVNTITEVTQLITLGTVAGVKYEEPGILGRLAADVDIESPDEVDESFEPAVRPNNSTANGIAPDLQNLASSDYTLYPLILGILLIIIIILIVYWKKNKT